MTTDGDDALLADLRSRDANARRGAEHGLFEQFRAPVERLLRRMLGEDTDDCLQEVFIDVFKGLRSFEGKARLSTWIYRVALRRAWKCAAARQRQVRNRENEVGPLEQLADLQAEGVVGAQLLGDELAQRFASALQRLDLDQRTVMALSALDGQGPAEIAEILGLPVGTVHSRLSRARDRLRELLGLTSEGQPEG